MLVLNNTFAGSSSHLHDNVVLQGGGTAHPINAKLMEPVPLAVAFKVANARFLGKHKPAKHMPKKHEHAKHMPSKHMPMKHNKHG